MCAQVKRIPLLLFWLTCFYSVRGLSEVSPHVTKKTHVISENEQSEPIILKCIYDAENYHSSLLVKWLKDGKPIYQWIKGHEPSVYASVKGIIEDKYEVSSKANYKYSAIKFPEPNINISGNYTCMVTMDTTQTNHIQLQIIDVSEPNFILDYKTLSNGTNVTCAVENVYPRPSLLITSEDDDIAITKIAENYEAQSNGYFNASTVASASKFDTSDVITCTVLFPGSDFNITKELTSSASIVKNTASILTIMFFIIINTIY